MFEVRASKPGAVPALVHYKAERLMMARGLAIGFLAGSPDWTHPLYIIEVTDDGEERLALELDPGDEDVRREIERTGALLRSRESPDQN